MLAQLVLHLHPRAVPAEALRFTRTFGLGGAAIVLVLLAAASGALLLPAYDPSSERAYGAISRIAHELPFGAFVRNVHHWAANDALLVSALHLLRVFYRGAHRPPRHVNWQIGLGLLALVVASAYTGRLLPWDQLAFWSVTASTAMLEYVPWAGAALVRAARGGAEVGPRTLALFFGLHVAILPPALCALLAFHVWLVRRAGGILLTGEGAPAAPRELVPTSPALTLREGVAALVTIAAVLLLAAVADAPLLAEANPGSSPDPAKAPWYLAGMQELLVHVHPAFGALALPSAAAALLVALPGLGRGQRTPGAWVKAAFTLALASHLVLTLVGAFFRGPGMALIRPWAAGSP